MGRSSGTDVPDNRRDVRRDGLQIVAPVYIELRNWLNLYFSTRAHHLAAQGVPVPPGEKKGAGNAIGRILAFVATLCDADIELMQELGGEAHAELDRLPPDYGKTSGRMDVLTLHRRERTVFCIQTKEVEPSESAAAAPGRPARPVEPAGKARFAKSLGHYEVRDPEKGEADDVPVPDRNRIPGRRK